MTAGCVSHCCAWVSNGCARRELLSGLRGGAAGQSVSASRHTTGLPVEGVSARFLTSVIKRR